VQLFVAHLEETCNYWLHIEKEEGMQTVRCAEGAGAPPAAKRAVGLAARLGTSRPPQASGQRWRAFALLVVAYFITIVDFTIVNVALPTIGRKLEFPSPICSGWSLPTG
jgi:hypothetical protein